MTKASKIAVGLSGGVDSTVAASLLKERGDEVVGVTMTLGRADEAQALEETRRVAERLGIPLHVFDLSAAWRTNVLDYIRDTYLGGATPNPCVRCNETVKFGLLPKLAFELGCDRFATGHYARRGKRLEVRGKRLEGRGERDEVGGMRDEGRGKREEGRGMRDEKGWLRRGVDKGKDQSYFLYRVRPEILARTEFPLGEMTKEAVRAKARELGLEVADRGDSQDFCGGDPMAVVGAAPREGDIVDAGGKVLGRHQGFWNYTIGKRKGLGIGGGIPYYVIGLDAVRNEVIVGYREETLVRRFEIADVVRLADGWEGPLTVKVRSAGEPKGPVVWDGGAAVECPEGLAGVAPGQSAVFFDGDTIVGGGIIARTK